MGAGRWNELRVQRKKLIDGMRAMVERAEKEKRRFTAAEETRWDLDMARAKELGKEANLLESAHWAEINEAERRVKRGMSLGLGTNLQNRGLCKASPAWWVADQSIDRCSPDRLG